ncbi:MAG TPA: iron-sulfur cluster assembly scaffold protein [Thermomicrobiales bacterium]|nr:iron-sulfur cluster assembly scaffold protein [Thermomicrobiales bacterium]HQZ90197.1 iron-sulfur cluster assembly scaffold protein [Thermomicrobiales bacterium]HRA30722.1 iron-sulfur cluster assembly scaffold protein [Thermomicrobiales bacterium]
MDRQEQIEILVDHYQNPRHRHAMDNPSVTMPGGNPGCGDVITIYLQPGDDGLSIADVSWEGEGCTISQAAASILMEMVHDERWTLEEALAHDYTTMIEVLGKEAVQMRPKCATLALGTLKAAVRKYQRDELRRQHGMNPDGTPIADLPEQDAEFGIIVGDRAHNDAGAPVSQQER